MELFSPKINATYFIDYDLIHTNENNYFYNISIKQKIKQNLFILNQIFQGSEKGQSSFRMKNQFGTIHYNIKVKENQISYPNQIGVESFLSKILSRSSEEIELSEMGELNADIISNSIVYNLLKILGIFKNE